MDNSDFFVLAVSVLVIVGAALNAIYWCRRQSPNVAEWHCKFMWRLPRDTIPWICEPIFCRWVWRRQDVSPIDNRTRYWVYSLGKPIEMTQQAGTFIGPDLTLHPCQCRACVRIRAHNEALAETCWERFLHWIGWI